jgi:hypothetical protein
LNQKVDFELSSDYTVVSPAFRQYFLSITGTDTGDKINQPILVVGVDDALT